ncbi:MAG: hypothetical protein Q9172_002765 [Xanthocarpia lactea]
MVNSAAAAAVSLVDQAQMSKETLLNGPAARPPVGVEPDFSQGATLNATMITIFTTCMLMTTLVVLARLYTKSIIVRSVAYEDSNAYSNGGGVVHMWEITLNGLSSKLYVCASRICLPTVHWCNVSSVGQCINNRLCHNHHLHQSVDSIANSKDIRPKPTW